MKECEKVNCYEIAYDSIDKELPVKAVQHYSTCFSNINYTWLKQRKEDSATFCYYHKKVEEKKIVKNKRRSNAVKLL